MNMNGSGTDCENHAGIPSVAACVVCGKPVCGDCSLTVEGKQLCNDASHRRIFEECAILGYCPSIFDADLVSQNLSAHGIKNYYFDPKYFHGEGEIRVFVEKQSSAKAYEMLSTLELNDFLTVKNNGR